MFDHGPKQTQYSCLNVYTYIHTYIQICILSGHEHGCTHVSYLFRAIHVAWCRVGMRVTHKMKPFWWYARAWCTWRWLLIYKCIYIYTYIHTYIHTYMCIRICTFPYVYIYIYIYIYIHIYKIYVRTNRNTCTHTDIYIYTHNFYLSVYT